MSTTAKRRSPSTAQRSAGSGIGGLLLMLGVLIGGGWFIWPMVTTGDVQWWSSSFNQLADTIVIHNRGQIVPIAAATPAFAALNDGINQSIRGGIRPLAMGFSDGTWQDMQERGRVVEVSYPSPVRIHSRSLFLPTSRMLLLLDGEGLHTTHVLFRQNADGAWDRLPFALDGDGPLFQALAVQGIN